MATIFSKIIAGEIPCYKVAEDEKNFAFLDINPVNKGHVLVVPKTENDYIFNLSDDDYQSLTMFARRVAKAIDKALPCKRVGVAVIGLEVPHAHIHLIPIVEEKDMYFDKQKLTLPAEEMQAIADAIAKEMDMYFDKQKLTLPAEEMQAIADAIAKEM